MDLDPVYYSQNYIWPKNDVIAEGSESTIYQAKHIQNGNMVALKWYKYDKNCSEIEELCKLDHKNVIKIFDVEKETITNRVVVAMEICTDGILADILRHRKNAFGFEESEFLLLLGNLAEGLSYLKNNYGGHVDVRPGNIMRTTNPNGVSLYKIIDFHAKPYEFNYLHMDYFDRWCKKDNSRNPDLFSVGAILYLAATGSVPFKSRNPSRDVMISLLTQKKREHISGRQFSEHGHFHYSKSLPVSTQLNRSLQELVVSLLVYIMDTEESPGPCFEKYVAMCKSITSKIKVRIFIVNSVKERVFHLDDQYNFQDIIALIKREFRSDDYLIFYDDKVLTKAQIAQNKSNKRNNIIHEFTVVEFAGYSYVETCIRKFKPDSHHISAEKIGIKEIYRVAYEALDFISEKSPICEWLNKSVQQFCAFFSNEVIVLELELKRLHTAKIFVDQTEEFRKSVEHITQIKYDLEFQIKLVILYIDLIDLEQIKLKQNELLTDWTESSTDLMKKCLKQPVIEAKTYLSHIDIAVSRIRQLEINNIQSSQIHTAERKHIIKMKDNMVELAQVVEKDFKKLIDCYDKWYMKAQSIYIYIEKLKKEFEDYTTKISLYKDKIAKELRQTDFKTDMEVVYLSYRCKRV